MNRAAFGSDERLWAITAYYNPLGYERRYTNYLNFRKALAGPLVVVEIGGPSGFVIPADDLTRVISIPHAELIWQKEALLNVALRDLPGFVTAVAWLDCDIEFESRCWRTDTMAALEHAPIVQLFSQLDDLGPSCTVNDAHMPSGRGIASIRADADAPSGLVHPRTTAQRRTTLFGLAWAARRSLLDRHGFYDAMIVGSGDRAMASAAFGDFDDVGQALCLSPARQKHFERWARPFFEDVAGSVGHLDCGIRHYWHGDIADRRYAERHVQLARLDFDPDRDLERDDYGLWRWRRDRPELATFMKAYFAGRKEDGKSQGMKSND